MQNKQRYITAGVTIVAAAATAHVMQSGSSKGSGVNGASVSPVAAAVAATVATTPEQKPGPKNEVTVVAAVAPTVTDAPAVEVVLPQEDPVLVAGLVEDAMAEGMIGSDEEIATDFPRPPSDVLMPSPLPNVGANLANRLAELAAKASDPLKDEVELNSFGLPCGPILSASTGGDSGLVKLTLTAPCRGEQRVEIKHGPLQFSALTDSLGTYQADIPAMTSDAIFTAAFEDGESFTTGVDVPAAANAERVAVVADSNAGLQIHALEFGADYDEPGHVWAEAPRDPALAGLDGGGYMIRLGDLSLENAIVSEVYTFPAKESGQSGVVRLSVEAEVTAMNCAKEVSGQSIEPLADGTPFAMSMTLAIPECDAIGEYLVLKNLLRDLRIASTD